MELFRLQARCAHCKFKVSVQYSSMWYQQWQYLATTQYTLQPMGEQIYDTLSGAQPISERQ